MLLRRNDMPRHEFTSGFQVDEGVAAQPGKPGRRRFHPPGRALRPRALVGCGGVAAVVWNRLRDSSAGGEQQDEQTRDPAGRNPSPPARGPINSVRPGLGRAHDGSHPGHAARSDSAAWSVMDVESAAATATRWLRSMDMVGGKVMSLGRGSYMSYLLYRAGSRPAQISRPRLRVGGPFY